VIGKRDRRGGINGKRRWGKEERYEKKSTDRTDALITHIIARLVDFRLPSLVICVDAL